MPYQQGLNLFSASQRNHGGDEPLWLCQELPPTQRRDNADSLQGCARRRRDVKRRKQAGKLQLVRAYTLSRQQRQADKRPQGKRRGGRSRHRGD